MSHQRKNLRQHDNEVKNFVRYSEKKTRSSSLNISYDKNQIHQSNSSLSGSDDEQYTQDEYSTDNSTILNKSTDSLQLPQYQKINTQK